MFNKLNLAKAIMLPVIELREHDLSWKDFLSGVNHHPRYLQPYWPSSMGSVKP